MIKSTKEDKAAQPNKDKYPCLMVSVDSDSLVILMTKSGEGMIVSGRGDSFYSTAGNYTNGWVMSNFKPYEGKITLENK